jgi:hypothetical protein
MGQTGGLGSNLVEHVFHQGVQDRHGLGRNTGVGVDLFQHLVQVDLIGFRLADFLLLLAISGLLGGRNLLSDLLCLRGLGFLWCHRVCMKQNVIK